MSWPFTVSASGSDVAVGTGVRLGAGVALGATWLGRTDACVAARVEVGLGWGPQAVRTPDTITAQTKHQPGCRQAEIKPLPNFIDWPNYTRHPKGRKRADIRI